MAEGKYSLDDLVDAVDDLLHVATQHLDIAKQTAQVMADAAKAAYQREVSGGGGGGGSGGGGGFSNRLLPTDPLAKAIDHLTAVLSATPSRTGRNPTYSSSGRKGRGGTGAPQGYLTTLAQHVKTMWGRGRGTVEDVGKWSSRNSQFSKWMGRRGAGIGKLLGGAKGEQAGASLGKSLGGKLGGIAAVATLVVTGFQKAHDAVVKWTEEALDSARKLAEVSGSMAAVMAERDIGQMFRDMRRGEATAGSAMELVRAEAGRKEQENRIGAAWDNIRNSVLSDLNDLLARALRPIADLMEEIEKELVGERVAPGGMGVSAFEDEAMARVRAMDAAGKTLMDVARDAAGAAGGARPGPAPRIPAAPGALP